MCSDINICLATVSCDHILWSLTWQYFALMKIDRFGLPQQCLLLNVLLYLQFTQNNLWLRFAFIRTAAGFIPHLKVLLDVTIKSFFSVGATQPFFSYVFFKAFWLHGSQISGPLLDHHAAQSFWALSWKLLPSIRIPNLHCLGSLEVLELWIQQLLWIRTLQQGWVPTFQVLAQWKREVVYVRIWSHSSD